MIFFSESEVFSLEENLDFGRNPYPKNASVELITEIDNFIKLQNESLKEFKEKTQKTECYYLILAFINSEIENEKQNLLRFQGITANAPEPIEIPENDFSDTVPLERMIILEKLGIIKYIQSLQNDKDNEKHTAEILSSFTGIVSGTIAKNLGVMLGTKKNDDDKNSPYKNPKNLNLANNKLDTFNIDLTKIIK